MEVPRHCRKRGKKREALRKARERKGLTQRQLAQEIGVKGPSSIWNFESGFATPPLHTAFKLAYVLEMDLKELFPDEAKPPEKREEINE